MLGHVELRRGVTGLGGFNNRSECFALSVSASLRGLRVVHGQIEQLGATRNSQLVKNAEQIILDRVWAELESCSDFAIGHTPGHVLDDLAFAHGEEFDSLVIGSADHRRVGESLKSMIEIDATRPYLTFMNVPNALAEALDSLLLGKNSPCAGAKALQNILGFGGVQQDDAPDLGPERTHLPQHLGTVSGLVVQIVTDHNDVDRHTSDGGQQFFGIRGLSYHLQAVIAAQSIGQELSVDASAVGNDNADKVRAQVLIG